MKLSKFLSITILITNLCLVYIYQQTEIFRLAYTGQKNLKLFQDLFDKNTILRYNIERNASLTRIGNEVFKVADFQMPDTYRLVRLAYTKENSKVIQRLPKKENIIARLFGIKRQAEAKTLNP